MNKLKVIEETDLRYNIAAFIGAVISFFFLAAILTGLDALLGTCPSKEGTITIFTVFTIMGLIFAAYIVGNINIKKKAKEATN